MKKFFVLGVLITVSTLSFAQSAAERLINSKDYGRLVKQLSSDDFAGRKINEPGSDKAAALIVEEFGKAHLLPFPDLENYRQTFTVTRSRLRSVKAVLNNAAIDSTNVTCITSKGDLSITEVSPYTRQFIDSSQTLVSEASRLLKEKRNLVVFVDSSHHQNFGKLRRFLRDRIYSNSSVVFILTNAVPRTWSFQIQNEVSENTLANIAGIIPGKSLPGEYVVFSAHYDHLGIGKPNEAQDSIFNGANDDASGVAAMILLAKYFQKLNNNERTIIFIAFTAEESGGYGSNYFSTQINPAKIVAMFNIEMIGTESKWGGNSAYITGYEKSDLGKLLQQNSGGKGFNFYPDPYPEQNLFYRSDNASLARYGVPAHTISSSKMNEEKFYHTVDDEFETLDIENATKIVKALAVSSKNMIDGKDTPTRVTVE